MVQGWLVIAALAIGLILGIGITAMLLVAAGRNRTAAAVSSGSRPAGIDAVLDVLDVPAILIDPSNQPVKASASAEAAGIANGVVHPEVLEVAAEVRSTGEPVNRELTIARAGRRDQPRHLRVSAALLGARYVLVVAEDRTEAVRLDEVRRDFVANVSHELKTPIGAVGLLAEALESAANDPVQVKKFAGRLSREAQRLASLTQDIIELSRVQGAGPILHSDLVKVDSIVVAAIDNNRVVAEAKAIEIVGGGAKGLAVYGHQPTLVTAVHNLIANAVQYSPERSRVGIGVTRREDAVEISVTDQGPGISDEDQERIFERFFRSDPARSRDTGGTGLGLSIVKHAVANHGGEVHVWSKPGQGSTFTIRLPLAEPQQAADSASRGSQTDAFIPDGVSHK